MMICEILLRGEGVQAVVSCYALYIKMLFTALINILNILIVQSRRQAVFQQDDAQQFQAVSLFQYNTAEVVVKWYPSLISNRTHPYQFGRDFVKCWCGRSDGPVVLFLVRNQISKPAFQMVHQLMQNYSLETFVLTRRFGLKIYIKYLYISS